MNTALLHTIGNDAVKRDIIRTISKKDSVRHHYIYASLANKVKVPSRLPDRFRHRAQHIP